MPPVAACAHAAWHEQGLEMPPASRCLEHPHLNDMNNHLAFLEPPNWARALPPPLWLVPWEQGHLPSAPTALREGQPQTWTWQEEVGSLVTTSRARRAQPPSLAHGESSGPEPWAQQRNHGRKEHSPERKQPLEAGQRESQPFQAWAGNAQLDLGGSPQMCCCNADSWAPTHFLTHIHVRMRSIFGNSTGARHS